ncbi:MAG: Oma1 [Parachlamydiales bacterium]|nr:Oma1 [Parachlamydiales bacterium]
MIEARNNNIPQNKFYYVAQPFFYIARRIVEICRTTLVNITDFILPKNPITHRREIRLLPYWLERSLAEKKLQKEIKLSSGEFVDEPIKARVNSIFQRLVAQCECKDVFNWEIKIVNDPKIEAFALMAGKIIIGANYVQNLCRKENADDLIAATISHEIVHICARDYAKVAYEYRVGIFFQIFGISLIANRFLPPVDEQDLEPIHRCNLSLFQRFRERLSGQLLFYACCRFAELRADKHGLTYMRKAGFNLQAAPELQGYFKSGKEHRRKQPDSSPKNKALHTHPNKDQRIDAINTAIKEIT